jgi:hypothetical protein
VQLDPSFAQKPRKPADAETRDSVRKLIQVVQHDLTNDWEEVLRWASSESVREWIALNNPPRKRG